MHDALTVGIPVLAIVLGAWFNNQGLRDLKAEVVAARAEASSKFLHLAARIDTVSADLNRFYQTLGKHPSIETLAKRQA